MISNNRLYYRIKPYLPWRLRMDLRRIVARRQRRRFAQTWPINPAAGDTPADWPGWPEGKKFALVLTHDVESAIGLKKSGELMRLEQQLNFRSSFNFIPEGDYVVPREFREELKQNGFEVGVHDLRHDGKLYWRRANFPENARSINHYLKEWNASGFRSGFMLHDRQCLHELNIQYDASTFDTDPFEPQPEGVHTIFPFWVPRGDGGYVEMPYTLPQDSTLFFVLEETSTDVWKKKLDWIVQRGGMALLNVHPDYINFSNKKKSAEYPVALYENFLKHIRANYSGAYWNALPATVANWYKKTCLTPEKKSWAIKFSQENPLKQKRVAVVLYSYYASDPRPRREAEALQRAGMEVDVICLRQNREEPRYEKINGVNVHRVPLKRRRAGKFIYVFQYFSFLTSAFLRLSAWSLKKKYQLVHVHNMPDFLVFSGLIPKLRGAKIILDLHDPMPELFRSIYGLPQKNFFVRWLERTEKCSIAFANLVLTPNLAFKNLFISRSCAPQKIVTVMNSPQTFIFDPLKYPSRNGHYNPQKTFILMYHGLLVERHGLDLAVRAVAELRQKIPGIQLHLYGEPTDYLKKIQDLVRELKLENEVQYHGYKTLTEIAQCISTIDVGLIPNRSSLFTQINFPTRIFEYLAMHKPVIVPNTLGIQDYFTNDEILFFQADDFKNLAEKIEWAYENPAALRQFTDNGRKIYEKYNWDLEEKKFLDQVSGLIKT
jgi:glycosyltransferase involved in cell wall biosynthesis